MILPGFSKDTWNQKDIQRLKTLILYIFVFCILLGVYNNGINQRIQYMQYKNNISEYDIVEGVIIDNSYSTRHYGNIPICKEYRQIIKFEYNDVEHVAGTNAYAQYNIGDVVKVAVNRSNYTTLNRCMPYETTKYEKELYVRYLILLLIVLIAYLIDRKHYKKEEYKIKRNTQNSLAKKEDDYNDIILEKQSLILKYIKPHNCIKAELKEEMISFSNIGIRFNAGTLWLLENYFYSKEMQKIFNLLLFMKTEDYCEYLKKMCEQGFPEDYYVLAKYNENYYCCCEESERLYMYSKGAGITNTKFATIYDYIIEQMDEG